MKTLGVASRVTVVRYGDSSYQATARNGAWFEVGEFCATPDLALRSACEKLDLEVGKVRKTKAMFEDIFG